MTLYSHGIVSFGVLVAVGVTTSGDEAFYHASSPSQNSNTDNNHPIFGSSLASLLYRLPALEAGYLLLAFPEEEACLCFDRSQIIPQMKAIPFYRFLLVRSVLLFGFSLKLINPLFGLILGLRGYGFGK